MNILTIAGVSDAKIELVPTAIATRDAKLAESAAITTIADRLDADAATALLGDIHRHLKEIEIARKEIKRPVDDLARKIQDTVQSYTAPLEAEKTRLSALLGSYQAAEVAKAEAERREAEAAARRVAIETSVQVAKTEAAHGEDSLEAKAARDAAIDKQASASAAISQTTPAKLKGAALRETYKFEVTDIAALMAYSRDLVTITPNAAAINAIIKTNQKIPGLKIWKESKVTAR